MLHGREVECAQVDGLLEGARSARSGFMMLRGDTGIGKSALLEYAVGQSSDLCVLRATGVDAEAEFAYAGLQQLLHPVLDRSDKLPTVQAEALRAAVGVGVSPVHDRFSVSIAVLGLLAEVADDRGGLLLVVDDVQWLDRPTTDALLFVARRLEAEGVAMLMACGAGGLTVEISGLPELTLGPLSEAAAAEVLVQNAADALSPGVAEQLLVVASGNPLALCELPSSLTADQLAGREPVEQPLPVRAHVERAFAHRIDGLSEHARALLILMAADDSGEWATLRLAALLLDIDPASVDELEAVGLITSNGRTVAFTQPLVRCVAYRRATLWRRRSAHLGLAEALESEESTDRRAWHLAAAAEGPNDEIADELERSALRARVRSGHAAAAAALERASDLTRDERRRAERLLSAAEANWLAGRSSRMAMLLGRAESLPLDPDQRVAAASLRGAYETEHGSLERAYGVLVAAAKDILEREPLRALEMLVRAGDVAWWAGRLDWAAELGRLAAAVPVSDRDDEAFMVDLLMGTSEALQGDFERGAATLRRALRIAETFDHPHYLLPASVGTVYLGDELATRRHLERAVSSLRAAGAIGDLPAALQFLAAVDLWEGRIPSAIANGFEALRLATETKQESSRAFLLALMAAIDAARGDDQRCRERAREALDLASRRGLALHATLAHWALVRLELGRGRPDLSLEHIAALADDRPGVSHPLMAMLATMDVVEGAVRCGEDDLGVAALQRLDAWTARTGSAWSQAWSVALHGWLAPDAEMEAHFADALTFYEQSALPYDEARVRLLYGERLRRNGRDAEARQEARRALVVFERIGAILWAERARAELAASGGLPTAPHRRPFEALTPQEQQIARFVISGATNREVGAKLFLSPRTTQYHLHSIYLKLGVESRAELAALFARDPGLDHLARSD